MGVGDSGGIGETGVGKVDARVSITFEGDAWEIIAVSGDVGTGEGSTWCCPDAVLARASWTCRKVVR